MQNTCGRSYVKHMFSRILTPMAIKILSAMAMRILMDMAIRILMGMSNKILICQLSGYLAKIKHRYSRLSGFQLLVSCSGF